MKSLMLFDELFALYKTDREKRYKLLKNLTQKIDLLLTLNKSSQKQIKQNKELKNITADLQT